MHPWGWRLSLVSTREKRSQCAGTLSVNAVSRCSKAAITNALSSNARPLAKSGSNPPRWSPGVEKVCPDQSDLCGAPRWNRTGPTLRRGRGQPIGEGGNFQLAIYSLATMYGSTGDRDIVSRVTRYSPNTGTGRAATAPCGDRALPIRAEPYVCLGCRRHLRPSTPLWRLAPIRIRRPVLAGVPRVCHGVRRTGAAAIIRGRVSGLSRERPTLVPASNAVARTLIGGRPVPLVGWDGLPGVSVEMQSRIPHIAFWRDPCA